MRRKEDWKAPVALDKIDIKEEAKKDCFLQFCWLLTVVTRVQGLVYLCLSIFFLIAPCGEELKFKGISTIKEFPYYVVKSYECVFALLIALVDTSDYWCYQHIQFLDSWILRGSFLTFAGSLSLLTASHCSNMEPSLEASVQLFSLCGLIVVGLLYLIMGLIGLQAYKSNQELQLKRRRQIVLQAQSLSQHKDEVERLLKQTEMKIQRL